MDKLSRLSSIGISSGGASLGTPSASFTRGFAVSSFSVTPKQEVKPVPQVRGNLATMRVTKGVVSYEPSLSFALDTGDADSGSIGDFLASVLGLETPTAVGGGIYKHKFTVKNTGTPPWLNLYSDKDAIAKQIVGFMVGQIKISIKANDPIINVEVSGIAKDESDFAAPQTLTFCDSGVITPQMATVLTFGGAACTFEDITLTFTRSQESKKYIDNTRVVNDIISGKDFAWTIEATGINFANETERAKFKAGTSSAFRLTLTDDASNYIDFNASEIYYTSWEDASVNDTDVLTIGIAALATGALTGVWVELQNAYAKRYDTDASIT
jgi:hypothetical protein